MRIGPFQYLKRDVFSNFKFSPLIYNIFLSKKEKCGGTVEGFTGFLREIPLRLVLHASY